MEFEYLFAIIRQFFHDPFNRKALDAKCQLIIALEIENERLRELLHIEVAGSNTKEKPQPLQPFRVRSSMRDRKAKKEASFNRVFNSIREVSEAIERGEIQDVHIQNDRKVIRQSADWEGNG